jgi:hypothetical protein
MAGIELFVAQYLQLVLDKGPSEAGLLTLPSAGGLVVGPMLAPFAASRGGQQPVLRPTEGARAAHETLGEAVEVATGLLVGVGADLLEVAHEAFLRALELAAGITALSVIAVAILTALLLRRVRTDAVPQAADPSAAALSASRE